MKARVVIGAGFGDEGKGKLVDFLCGEGADLCVRFNGGAQAGHTVDSPIGRHVFGHLGSGTFTGVPTYLSEHFIVNPRAFIRELAEVNAIAPLLSPKVYVSPQAIVTTPLDVLANQAQETLRGNQKHGSCGMGIFQTIERHKEASLYVGDALGSTFTLDKKVSRAFDVAIQRMTKEQRELAWVKKVVENRARIFEVFTYELRNFANTAKVSDAVLSQAKLPVFEGAQGLLLDQNNLDFFPHLTPSNTGLKNVIELLGLERPESIEVTYVIRSYLTRHGSGPLPHERHVVAHVDQTNVENEWQGQLRQAPLNLDLVLKAIKDDLSHVKDLRHLCPVFRNLAITHTDVLPMNTLSIVSQGNQMVVSLDDLIDRLGLPIKYFGIGPKRADIIKRFTSL